MKKILCALLSLMLILSCSLTALAAGGDRLEKIKKEGKLVVGTSPDYAPYEFLDLQGNPVGSDMVLAQYIADKLGVKLQVEKMDFDTVLGSVAAGKIDIGIAGMVPKESRKEIMDFTDVYYNDGDQVILIAKKNADAYKTLADFAGKTVAAQNGSLQQTLVTDQLPNTKLETIVKISDAVMMVLAGKVEGLALASVVANQYIANYPDLAICEGKFEYQSLGVAAAVPKGEETFLKEINAILKELDGTKDYYKWIDEALVLASSLK